MNNNFRLWFARGLIFPVFFLNVQCALLFLLNPETFAPGFELSGEPGEVVIRGFGILFLMWNVPYCIALLHPIKKFISLSEAVIMQLICAFAETLLFASISETHVLLRGSVLRFLLFDAAGFLLLATAWLLVVRLSRKHIGLT